MAKVVLERIVCVLCVVWRVRSHVFEEDVALILLLEQGDVTRQRGTGL